MDSMDRVDGMDLVDQPAPSIMSTLSIGWVAFPTPSSRAALGESRLRNLDRHSLRGLFG
jgi:hypothetical protein